MHSIVNIKHKDFKARTNEALSFQHMKILSKNYHLKILLEIFY